MPVVSDPTIPAKTRAASMPPDPPDFRLRTTSARLADIAEALAKEIPNAPEENRPTIARLSIGLLEVLGELNAVLQEGGKPPGPPVAPGTGAGDNGGMEKRVENLETDMKDVRDRLVRIETKLDSKASESSVVDVVAKLDAKAEKSDVLKTEVRLILLGAGAWVSLLFVFAKGFKWF